jgi:hypothetical protein
MVSGLRLAGAGAQQQIGEIAWGKVHQWPELEQIISAGDWLNILQTTYYIRERPR